MASPHHPTIGCRFPFLCGFFSQHFFVSLRWSPSSLMWGGSLWTYYTPRAKEVGTPTLTPANQPFGHLCIAGIDRDSVPAPEETHKQLQTKRKQAKGKITRGDTLNSPNKNPRPQLSCPSQIPSPTWKLYNTCHLAFTVCQTILLSFWDRGLCAALAVL